MCKLVIYKEEETSVKIKKPQIVSSLKNAKIKRITVPVLIRLCKVTTFNSISKNNSKEDDNINNLIMCLIIFQCSGADTVAV